MEFDCLASQAVKTPHKIALYSVDQSWTYQELDVMVTRLQQLLHTLGVNKGNKVAVHLPNQVLYICLIHALPRIGAVIVPLNLRLSTNEIVYQLEHSQSDFIILDPISDFGQSFQHKKSERPIQIDLNSLSLTPTVPKTEVRGGASNLLGAKEPQAILFTSGTTGKPKGAVLCLENHLSSAQASAERLGNQENDIWLLCMPLYHVGGMAIVFRAAYYGIAIRLLSRFEANEVLVSIQNNPVTIISLVPTMLARLMNLEGGTDALSKLRVILLGGAAADSALIQKGLKANLSIATSYGLTEAASQVATLSPNLQSQKMGSVGLPLKHFSVKICDTNGVQLAQGEIGEVWLKGPGIMLGYYNDPEANAKAFEEGFFKTGDLGYLDEASFLYIVQRRTDLIISGGENVYPSEVEAVLQSHPDVAQACVLGQKDPEWGQRVVAAIVLANGSLFNQEAIQQHLNQQIARYKIPKTFYIFKQFPMTASGKVIRKEIQIDIDNNQRNKEIQIVW